MSTYINNETGHHFRIDKLPAPQFLKEYLNYILAIENLTVRTVDNYYILLKGFLAWAHLRYEGLELSKKDVDECDITKMNFNEVSVLTTQDLHEYLSFAKDEQYEKIALFRQKVENDLFTALGNCKVTIVIS